MHVFTIHVCLHLCNVTLYVYVYYECMHVGWFGVCSMYVCMYVRIYVYQGIP